MTPAPIHTALADVAEIRRLEAAFSLRHPKISLMQRAGEAVAAHVLAYLKKSKSKNVLVLAGPGNNGGDAWVAAAALQRAKCRVTVLALGEQTQTDAAAQAARAAFLAADGEVVKSWPKKNALDVVIDGLFGIGISRAPSGAVANVINQCNQLHRAQQFAVLSIDVPSGLNADTGVAFDPAIEADETLTFIAAKPGLYTADGVDCAGAVIVDALGVTIPESQTTLLTRDDVLPLIRNPFLS